MRVTVASFLAGATVAVSLTVPGAARAEDSVVGVDWKRTEHKRQTYGPRYEHRGVVFDGKMIIAGGQRAAGWLADVWASTNGHDWEPLVTNAPWPARAQHGLAVHDGMLWLSAGVGVELYNDIWYSADGSEWAMATGDTPWLPRSDFGFVSLGGELFVAGGHGPHERLNDVWASGDGVTWEARTLDAPWGPRSHHATVAHSGHIYILGGAHFDYEENDYVYHNDVWKSTDGAEWELVREDASWSPRYLHRVVSMHDRLWLFGGDDFVPGERLLTDSWHSGDGSRWFQLAESSNIEPRQYFVLLPYQDSLWILGGMDPTYGIFKEVERNYVSEGEIPLLAPFRR